MSAARRRYTSRVSRFLVLDGIDGCGKSTQAELLCSALGRRAPSPPLHLREPGSTAVGERLRDLILDPALHLNARTEALLFCAARAQSLDELVAPALAQGRDVVCERFHPSTFAYQAVAGQLDPERVLALLSEWAGSPAPDLVLILDLSVEEAARRRGAARDRIEAHGLAFQERVLAGYRRWAELDPHARVVDGRGSPEEVHARVLAEVERG